MPQISVSVLFWVAIVALAVFAIVRLTGSERRGGARAILDERLARGEIGDDEYRSRKALLAQR